MPQIVSVGKELVRINTQKNSIDYSHNEGRSWVMRCNNSSYGTFRDLLLYGVNYWRVLPRVYMSATTMDTHLPYVAQIVHTESFSTCKIPEEN